MIKTAGSKYKAIPMQMWNQCSEIQCEALEGLSKKLKENIPQNYVVVVVFF